MFCLITYVWDKVEKQKLFKSLKWPDMTAPKLKKCVFSLLRQKKFPSNIQELRFNPQQWKCMTLICTNILLKRLKMQDINDNKK